MQFVILQSEMCLPYPYFDNPAQLELYFVIPIRRELSMFADR